MTSMFSSGISLRWLNNAGFELVLPDGAHLLVDPWLDSAQIYPVLTEQIERADYILLTHIHFDHAEDVGKLQKKFPQVKILTGDLSAAALCEWQQLNLEKIYRVRGGECYEFDDVKIEAIAARHTESTRGSYYMEGNNQTKEQKLDLAMWFGSLEMLNYRITANDGTSVVVWGGMTTDEQVKRMEKVKNNDIAIMHVSPKQDSRMFSQLVKAINPKVVIPHHYDLWDVIFKSNPQLLEGIPLPPEEINEKNILGLLKKYLGEECPNSTFYIPEHHKWYRFGLAVQEIAF